MLLQGNQGQVGKQTGQNIIVGMGEFTDLLLSELMGRYYEQTYRGNKFCCSTAGGGYQLVAGNLFSAAFSAFYPILAVYNRPGNSVNLVLTRIWAGITSSPLATTTQTGAFLLVAGAPNQNITNAQTATPVNCKTLVAAGSAAVGITGALLAGYLPQAGTPTVLRPLSGDIIISTATASVTSAVSAINVEEESGALIVPPGQFLAIANGVSNAVSGILATAGMEWDEIPI